MTDPGPPNYGIAELFMVLCAKRYAASLGTGRILIGEIEGHPAPCPEELYPDQAGIQALFQDHEPVWARVGAVVRSLAGDDIHREARIPAVGLHGRGVHRGSRTRTQGRKERMASTTRSCPARASS